MGEEACQALDRVEGDAQAGSPGREIVMYELGILLVGCWIGVFALLFIQGCSIVSKRSGGG